MTIPPDFEVVPCPGCGSSDFTKVRDIHAFDVPCELTCTIVCCNECGLDYTSPRPRLDELGKYYPSDYSPYRDGGDAPAGEAGSIRNLVLRNAYGAPKLRPSLPGRLAASAIAMIRKPSWFGFGVPYRGEGRLLDVGCGGGKFLRRMHALGWNVTGLDFSETAIQSVRAAGLRGLVGTLPHPQLAASSFDVVTLRHVLEHVPDPPATLRAAWQLLDAGGQLHIQVPNFAGWDVGYFGDVSLGLDVPRHFTHFTPATLGAMLKRELNAKPVVHVATHSNWIRKAAKRDKTGRTLAGLCRSSSFCRAVGAIVQLRNAGNEIVASVEKSPRS